MPMFIDLPDGTVTSSNLQVVGWAATNEDASAVAILVNGVRVAHHALLRPELRSVPDLAGFSTLIGVAASVQLQPPFGPSVVIELRCGDESHRTELPSSLTSVARDQESIRLETRAWITQRLRCPSCRSERSALRADGDALRCSNCQRLMPQHSSALNMIPPDIAADVDLTPTSNVSSNPYTRDALALLEFTIDRGGWVLDCGAGSRPERRPNVVNLEIVDYPSTDVLGAGECLPFHDATFDAVLSLAVLEHVRDPMQCAREMMRVLKPGGMIRADVPFLQPVHGFPNHYYNMTQAGLVNLFAGLGEVIATEVPLHGHPIAAVQWILSEYRGGLPDDAKASFEAMTIGEVAGLDPVAFVLGPHPAAAAPLAPGAMATIACLNSILVRKS